MTDRDFESLKQRYLDVDPRVSGYAALQFKERTGIWTSQVALILGGSVPIHRVGVNLVADFSGVRG